MIVDASALMTIVRNENDRHVHAEALFANDGRLRIAPMNLWEAFAVAERSKVDGHRANLVDLERALSLEVVPTDTRQMMHARDAWRGYGRGSGHPAQLNFGDCFAYALAKTLDEPLLFKGDDFIHTDIRSAL